MEPTTVRSRMVDRIQHMASYAIIKDRRFLDDEQLIRSEQMTVLEEIFNANVRDAEIQELSSHFAGILRGDHPCHMAIWGKTGTGKTLTLRYFLNLLSEMAAADHVPLRHEHLDFSTPRPCFRALNDLACLFNASKLYKKGISLEELMLRTEAALTAYRGYLILFIDEVDNVRRDRDAFLSFLVRRLPQRIPAKLILVFVSNRLNWPDHLDPRVKSFLKLNELIFKPYDAVDLQHILRIRVEKALVPGAVAPGVIEKIAALASQDHGDARQAVALLAKGAYRREGRRQHHPRPSRQRRHRTRPRSVRYPPTLRTCAAPGGHGLSHRSQPPRQGRAHRHRRDLRCLSEVLRPHRPTDDDRSRFRRSARRTGHVFPHPQSRFVKGRYGRTREITLDVSDEVTDKLYASVRMNFEMRR